MMTIIGHGLICLGVVAALGLLCLLFCIAAREFILFLVADEFSPAYKSMYQIDGQVKTLEGCIMVLLDAHNKRAKKK